MWRKPKPQLDASTLRGFTFAFQTFGNILHQDRGALTARLGLQANFASPQL